MNFQPVGANERISSLDILRGFSLLGILLVNMFGFYLPMPYVFDLSYWFTEAQDIILHQILDIYVQSSFYPLFSMLFGYGLAMQYMKAQKTGTNFYQFAPKRLVILFIIGMLHAILIWWGDILAIYAFCGFFLLMLLRFKGGTLLTIALAINGLFHAFLLFVYAQMGMLSMPVEKAAVDITAIENVITAYGVGTWTDAFMQRLDDLSLQMGGDMWISGLFTILPYMLVGAAAAKWRLIERAKEKMGLWIALAILGLGLGIFIKSAPITFTRTYGLDYLKVYVGGPLLSIGYIAVIVLVCLLPIALKLLGPIAKAGRMSMTLYLMQSVICTTLFYHWGFGLYGQVDVQMGIYIALGIYATQLVIAELWLSKFTQGPVEATVKKLTYRKKLSEK
ncbi:DUF418 domain-containing protein [Solibacillus sp. FSL H8-0538]|uniref:DUF418 domain-containing protein n=1 Tax=Solibacillus sp. FSL H8-0538 TaxID=2921400 RepID=UPI0030FAA82A